MSSDLSAPSPGSMRRGQTVTSPVAFEPPTTDRSERGSSDVSSYVSSPFAQRGTGHRRKSPIVLLVQSDDDGRVWPYIRTRRCDFEAGLGSPQGWNSVS